MALWGGVLEHEKIPGTNAWSSDLRQAPVEFENRALPFIIIVHIVKRKSQVSMKIWTWYSCDKNDVIVFLCLHCLTIYRNFRSITRTADYPHRPIIAYGEKKSQRITRTGG